MLTSNIKTYINYTIAHINEKGEALYHSSNKGYFSPDLIGAGCIYDTELDLESRKNMALDSCTKYCLNKEVVANGGIITEVKLVKYEISIMELE